MYVAFYQKADMLFLIHFTNSDKTKIMSTSITDDIDDCILYCFLSV